jgi:type III restriction enzyme
MKLKLEELDYQQSAILSVVKIFEGTAKNTFDNATIDGIRFNRCNLGDDQLKLNIKAISEENGISEDKAQISESKNLCVEMETGTGKTLVYLKTIYELYKHYGFTKFIILVPSVPIRQGVLSTLKTFEKQLNDIYGFTPDYFEYSSKKLHEVGKFAEEQHPNIMIMTTGAIVGDDKIINREQREDLFDNTPYIDVIGKTKPIIIMDEPQEGMDADKTKPAINRLNPLYRIRYSATHKKDETYNLIYRLTPYHSYKQNLVKKIEVLTVTEKNDEATAKIEIAEIKNGKGDPQIKLNAWLLQAEDKIVFKATVWLKVGDNLGEKTKNPSYTDYKIERIYKSMRDGKYRVQFTNGTEIVERQTAGNLENIWAMQMEWLIHRHLQKTEKLQAHGIKCLSLIFIDRVANYIGANPVIKNLFVKKYREIYPEYNGGKTPTDELIESIQGFYFATVKNEYTDSEKSMNSNKEIYDLILRKKEELLTLENPVQFIFSHSALGVGWDNPNVFNIATLNNSYSDIKKRQEIGRGLRIAVNQEGQRIYDGFDVSDETRINELTIVPNETYETFVAQYQDEIKKAYGDNKDAPPTKHTHKGEPKNTVKVKLNENAEIQAAFRRFWQKIARKTDYTVSFDEEKIIEGAVDRINQITISDNVLEAESNRIREFNENSVEQEDGGSERIKQKSVFNPLDLIEELSENTQLSYKAVFRITQGIERNYKEWIKNPLVFVLKAAEIIRQEELDSMVRGISYSVTDEEFPLDFDKFVQEIEDGSYVDTPHHGVFDKIKIDSKSTPEREFAQNAESDNRVVCFLKLPSYYKIPTPFGNYEPDFGIVLRRRELRNGNDEGEFHFVVETKGTDNLDDDKKLRPGERIKIKCAVKHFKALGIAGNGDINFEAPIQHYETFKTRAKKITDPL